MKLENFREIITLILLTTSAILIVSSCRNQDYTGKVIEAYKNLYAAVKSRDTEKIKQTMSKNSLAFAEQAAALYKKPIEEVLRNGFTGTTFSDRLPEIRDERIKENSGAVEVWNEQEKKWEDLPFILEDGTWKLAVGDVFKGSFKSPGKGRAAKEQEAANSTSNTIIPVQPSPSNTNDTPAATNANAAVSVKPTKKNSNINK
jgi:hypothetical protein